MALAIMGAGCSSPLESGLQERIKGLVKAAMADGKSPGAVVGVRVPGREAWAYAAGKADIASERAMSEDMNFRIGSNTKTFVATVVLQLAQEKKLDLEDTLDEYDIRVPNAGAITIRDLLNMTSGLYNYVDSPDLDIKRDYEPEELVAIAAAQPPLFAPGERGQYCNTNYIILGMIIEAITGNELRDEVHGRIIDQLGLHHTYFPDSPAIPGPRARGYNLGANGSYEDVTDFNPSWAWACGEMISNLDDMHAFGRALADGTLLNEEMQAERLKTVKVAGTSPGVADYGLGIKSLNGMLGHTGGIAGYLTASFAFPDGGGSVVVLLNTFNSYALHEFYDLLRDIVREALDKELPERAG